MDPTFEVRCRDHDLLIGPDGWCPGWTGTQHGHHAWIHLDGGTLDIGIIRRRTARDRLARPLSWLSRLFAGMAERVADHHLPPFLEAFKEESTVEELGKVAYEAYGEARGWETVGGGRMPSWGEQSWELQDAWNAAAQAVAAKLVG